MLLAQQSGGSKVAPGNYDPRTQRWSAASSAGASAAYTGTRSQNLRGQSRVLVVTRRFDPHADAVIDALDTLGIEALRINSEDLLSAYSFSWHSHACEGDALTIADQFERRASLPSGILSGYYRAPMRVTHHGDLRSSDAQSFSSSEGDSFLESIYGLQGMRWISPPSLIRLAEAKLPQLQLALSLGLRIPRTIVTNSPTEAHRFANSVDYSIASKSLTTPSVRRDDDVYDTYTCRLTRDELEEQIESVRFAPTLLQEYVPKSVEIRVTIIGTEIFATEIDSQVIEDAQIDWRRADPFTIPHRSVSLPDTLISILRRFLDHYGLSFGAIDLIRTPDDEYVFLENNPNGQWYWLEVLCGQPMAASMAKLLTREIG